MRSKLNKFEHVLESTWPLLRGGAGHEFFTGCLDQGPVQIWGGDLAPNSDPSMTRIADTTKNFMGKWL